MSRKTKVLHAVGEMEYKLKVNSFYKNYDNGRIINVYKKFERKGFFKDVYRYEIICEYDSNCYLTTASVNYMGLDDDCYELSILRNFRDTYMKSLPSGEQEISYYYNIAPKIVKAINNSESREEILSKIYFELIKPCVKLINEGELEQAHRKYKVYSLELESKLIHN
ncbi:CFI-box-CTERM domain-containing protein [Streptococcus salivarius]|uniref:CFI-box-CTERM domain-containing protein n=1 Tax=Streptococcus salivarius TaxID=1304 RepID=UPI00158442CA|nr:CFI-box-CTERM domain-containing protein [Streptococcus salivarius]